MARRRKTSAAPALRTVTFDSIDEFVDRAESGEVPTSNRHRASRSNDYDFTGTFDFNEACTMAREGWHSKREAITADVSIASDELSYSGTAFATSGAYVDMGRYVTGEPECMVEFTAQPAPRIVRIGVDMSFSAWVSADTIMESGAYVVALIDRLAECGIGVEVMMMVQIRKDVTTVMRLAVQVKRSDAPLDVDGLAFMVGHPSALRRLVFSIMEQQPDAAFQRQIVDMAYGSVCHDVPDGVDFWTGDMSYPPNVLERIETFLAGE